MLILRYKTLRILLNFFELQLCPRIPLQEAPVSFHCCSCLFFSWESEVTALSFSCHSLIGSGHMGGLKGLFGTGSPKDLLPAQRFSCPPDFQVDVEFAPWTQLYHRRPLLTGCVLWPEKSVCTFSAAALLELCWSSVLLPLFICVHLSLHVALATTLSVLVSLKKNFFAIILAFWGLAPSSPGSFWYTWCSWKKWCS